MALRVGKSEKSLHVGRESGGSSNWSQSISSSDVCSVKWE